MPYKWEFPGEWLQQKILEERSTQQSDALANRLMAILPLLDSDTIQELFEPEMDADGYFDQITGS